MKNRLLLSALLLAGCGQGGDDGPKSEIDGKWERGCHYIAADDRYDKEQLVYSGGSANYTFTRSLDSTCSLEIYSLDAKATFKLGDNVTLSTGQTARKIDQAISSVLLTPRSDSTATAYNTAAFCGFANWKNDEPKDITNCDKNSFGKNRFDIVKIEGDNLFLGDNTTGDGKTEAARPTRLESEFYTRSK